jgi:hypothetical protein
MIKSISEKASQIEVDLLGPDGNAFVLIGKARAWAKQLGLDPATIEQEMTSSDYEHLIETLEKHFGDFVVFYR